LNYGKGTFEELDLIGLDKLARKFRVLDNDEKLSRKLGIAARNAGLGDEHEIVPEADAV